MNSHKPMIKKTSKHDRERKVLIGLIDYYIKTGKPVGSNTLKDIGFKDLSSATLRNYFAHLEEEGYLKQPHSSGGRIPTEKGYRLYISDCQLPFSTPKQQNTSPFDSLRNTETREISSFLQRSAEELSHQTATAVFLSAPRFEQDFVTSIRLLGLDTTRCLAVLLTDFGGVMTETLYLPHKINSFSLKRTEAYFHWRLTGQRKPEDLSREEEALAQQLYNELMVRYIINYPQFGEEDIYRTGLSSLLTYPEFHDAQTLANTLALFEHTQGMQLLLTECKKLDTFKFWIGSDLAPYSPHAYADCTILAFPYCVNGQPVGSIGLLGPMRLPYRQIIHQLNTYAEMISETLTRNLYKFKITLRRAKSTTIDHKQKKQPLIEQSQHLLLEDNTTHK